MYEIAFPKNKDQREMAYDTALESGRQSRHVEEVNWWIAYHYLRGARDFTGADYRTGRVDVNYTDENGILHFRYDDILSKYQAQLGRMIQIDLTPKVKPVSIGLDSLRKSTAAQIILSHAFSDQKLSKLKDEMYGPYLSYGTIGLALWTAGEKVGIECVMPWELIPLPADIVDKTQVRGIARERIVPLEWVKGLSKTPGASAKVWDEMDTYRVPAGNIPTETEGYFTTFGDSLQVDSESYKTGGKGQKTDETQVDVVRFTEVWLENEQGYLGVYDMYCGGKIIHTQEYTGSKIYMPVQVARDIPVGGFWGRSFVSTLLPLNVEMEYCIGALFQNLQDLDAFGILALPSSLGANLNVVRGRDGLKKLVYEPDYSVPDQKPFNLAPASSGSFPVDGVKLGATLSDRIANQPTELLGGDSPGRVDSQAALGFLYEVSNTPLTSSALSISQALVGCYKSALNILGEVWRDKAVEVSLLDDTLLGLNFDARDGTMQLSNAQVPHPDEVEVSIGSALPQSKQQEKMELQQALELGAIDMFEYRTLVRKKGLSLPVGNEAEWQNYRKAVMNNIVLYGDGQSPGKALYNEDDMHEVHLRVIQAFRARPEFELASQEVREAFKELYRMHMMGMGALPDAAPYPEQAAEEAAMMQQIMASPMGTPAE